MRYLRSRKRVDARGCSHVRLAGIIERAAIASSCVLVFICGLAVNGCGSGRDARSDHRPPTATEAVSPPVARVSGRAITEAELTHWARLAAPSDDASTRAVRSQVLGFLIFSRWLLDEAGELHVSVLPSVVKQEATELVEDEAEKARYQHMPHDPELRQLLISPRLGERDRDLLIELTLLVPKIERARIGRARELIARGRIARFYALHRRWFYLPNQRQVEIIGGLLSEVLQGKREIEDGKPFLEVAKRRSSDPEAPGGLWRLLLGHDEPQVEDQIFSAKLHALIGPKKYSEFYIFDVLEARPAHQETLAEAEDAIRKRFTPSSTQLQLQAERRWRARTSCRRGLPTTRCEDGRTRRPNSRKRRS
jgi:hypothetical protein